MLDPRQARQVPIVDLLDGLYTARERQLLRRQGLGVSDHRWCTPRDAIACQPDPLRRGRKIDARPLLIRRAHDFVVHKGQVVGVAQDVELPASARPRVALDPAAADPARVHLDGARGVADEDAGAVVAGDAAVCDLVVAVARAYRDAAARVAGERAAAHRDVVGPDAEKESRRAIVLRRAGLKERARAARAGMVAVASVLDKPAR